MRELFGLTPIGMLEEYVDILFLTVSLTLLGSFVCFLKILIDANL